MANSSAETVAPYTMTSEPPLSFRAAGYDYDHEVLVSLPTSYSVSPDRSYPVVWAMDGAMMHTSVVGLFNMYALATELVCGAQGRQVPGFPDRRVASSDGQEVPHE